MTSRHRPLSGCRTLVVDDCPQITRLLQDVLIQWGGSVVTAASGEDGLRCLAENDFDLLLLDVVLPDMDVVAFRQRMRALRPDLAGRVVLMTGDRWHRQTARNLGDVDVPVLFKPFSFERLLETLTRRYRSDVSDEAQRAKSEARGLTRGCGCGLRTEDRE